MELTSILVVEDDRVIQAMVDVLLRQRGWSPVIAESGEEAIVLLQRQSFHLLLTDLMLPGIDGLAVMAAARTYDPEIESILITGAASLDSAIAAIRYGACAYIRKPIQADDLRRTVHEALMRRRERVERSSMLRQLSAQILQLAEPRPTQVEPAAPTSKPEQLEVGSLQIDLQRYLVIRGGQAMQLSQGEFGLLVYLARHREQVISPQQLLRDLDGYNCDANSAREIVKVRIHKLRQKIEQNPSVPRHLLSVRGIGYVLTAGERPR